MVQFCHSFTDHMHDKPWGVMSTTDKQHSVTVQVKLDRILLPQQRSPETTSQSVCRAQLQLHFKVTDLFASIVDIVQVNQHDYIPSCLFWGTKL